jgi:hypothetical protein
MGDRMLPEPMGFGQRDGPRWRLSIRAGSRNIPNLEPSNAPRPMRHTAPVPITRFVPALADGAHAAQQKP